MSTQRDRKMQKVMIVLLGGALEAASFNFFYAFETKKKLSFLAPKGDKEDDQSTSASGNVGDVEEFVDEPIQGDLCPAWENMRSNFPPFSWSSNHLYYQSAGGLSQSDPSKVGKKSREMTNEQREELCGHGVYWLSVDLSN